MPKTFHVTAPDGKVLEITGPDDATEEQAIEQAKTMYQPQAAAGPSPSLLESRKAASKAEFEANLPKQTVGTAVREGLLGIPESLGLANVNPIDTLKGIGSSVVESAKALSPMGLAQDPMRAVNMAKNAATGVIAPAQEVAQAIRESDANKFMHGLTGMVAVTAPAIGSALAVTTQGISNKLAKAKALRDFKTGGNPAATNVEQGIAPSSKEGQASTLRIAPELAQDPMLAKAKGIRFQQNLFNKFKNAEAEVNAAEKSIPRNTPVPQQPITNGLESIVEKYNNLGEPEAAKAVAKEWELWASKDPQISWEDFISRKRQFGKDLRLTSAFRETGNAADKAKAAALREAYGVLMETSNDVGGDALKAANRQYWLTHQAVENAGMDFQTGRRLAEVGKPPTSPFARATKRIITGAALGGGGVAGWELRRYLEGQ